MPNHVPKSHLVRIIKPRIEEILELVRDRLKDAGYAAQAGRRVVLTGGASQLAGLPEAGAPHSPGPGPDRPAARRQGLPEAAKGPPSRRRSGCWSIRRSRTSSTSSRAQSGCSPGRERTAAICRSMGQWIQGQFLSVAFGGGAAALSMTVNGAGRAQARKGHERAKTMTINLQAPDIRELKPRITVFGVGGAGGNAVNNMIELRPASASSSSWPTPTPRR